MEDVHRTGLLGMLEIEEVPGRDLFMVGRYLDPIEAHLARGCLVAAGIPAVVADDNMSNQPMVPVMGGVRVLVPESFIQQSQEVLAALARGDYALGDDADVGPAE
ncbi:DUF2007 domain-containing protein [Massilia sp. TSP1-1-2]|uniref:putative signal transducing protein n=1 Tax=unclassified Massilia TaxID=2609279 RepID=UPI003CF4FE66